MKREIKMLDLVEQHKALEPRLSNAIQRQINSGVYIQGAGVRAFEKELADYLEVNHVISCGNGTDALQIALMALGLDYGDEVIMPAFTYMATAEVVALLGLKVVFVDVEKDSFLIDTAQLKEAITSKTKAIMPVHLYGQCANMDEVMSVAKAHDLYVIEDTAQALGADYNGENYQGQAGTIGDVGTTSFFPTKNLGGLGDGGALFTNDDVLATKIRMIANHGQEQKYKHKIVGVNSRLDAVQAAALSVKLPALDGLIYTKQVKANLYENAFFAMDEVKTPFRNAQSTHTFHQYTILVKDKRDELKAFLADKGVQSMIYYDTPLHLQEALIPQGYKKGDFPISEDLSNRVLTLPIHTTMSDEDVLYVGDCVKEFYGY